MTDRVLGRGFLNSGCSVIAIAAIIGGTAFAGALPTGGHYTAGQGSMGKVGQSLTIKQSTTTGVIDWKSFSIGAKNGVTFDNGSGATLNRVADGNLSRIAGSLHATGSLYLLNSQGVIVSGTGRVVTGGAFVASSGDSSNDAFGDGQRLRGANAKIVNRGMIAAGGTVALVGSHVRNTGTISGSDVRLRATTGNALAGGMIRANGRGAGVGHILVIASSGETAVTGHLVARGANGGRIETSGAKLFVVGNVDAGEGGRWLLDPKNLTVTTAAAKTIDKSLNAGTSVELKTTKTSTSGPGTSSSGAGDVVIGAALKWTTDAQLTLDAYHSVVFKRAVDATDEGGVSITTAHGGNLMFEGGNLEFGNTGSALTINGASYTLVSTLAQLGEDVSGNPDGAFAIANSINAKSLGTLKASPIASDIQFGGIVEGLGNTISNLTINDSKNQYIGLVADNATGVVRDINLTAESITAHSNLSGDDIGGLVGYNGGTVYGSSVSGKISGATESATGGLVGINWGEVENSFSTASVAALANGASVGGLVGDSEGLIDASYETGNVSGGSGDDAGGLVGSYNNDNGGNHISIENSYARGNVKGSNSTIGGLGGLIGLSQGGKIEYAYATGTVTGKNSVIGGVVGTVDPGGTFKDVYWDTTTSKISASHGAGSATNEKGIKGETTAQLGEALPAGFSGSTWDQSAQTNGGLPYLTALAWSY
jgi:filamentous hemagglutinin family protein